MDVSLTTVNWLAVCHARIFVINTLIITECGTVFDWRDKFYILDNKFMYSLLFLHKVRYEVGNISL